MLNFVLEQPDSLNCNLQEDCLLNHLLMCKYIIQDMNKITKNISRNKIELHKTHKIHSTSNIELCKTIRNYVLHSVVNMLNKQTIKS